MRQRRRSKGGWLLDTDSQHASPHNTVQTGPDLERRHVTPPTYSAQASAVSPSLLERLVVELLLKMGYGGSRQDAGRAIGRSGDEDIDGIINKDRQGPDIIYIRAKNSFQNDAPPSGCDRRERAKDAGSVRSGATGATEDDGSLR